MTALIKLEDNRISSREADKTYCTSLYRDNAVVQLYIAKR
jgi:hypothetical protein